MEERDNYQPIIQPFLQALSRVTIPIILDTSEMGVNCHLLMVAVGYQRRALPLAYLWMCFLGSVAILTGQAKRVDRSDRRDRSIFTIGYLPKFGY